MKKRGLLLVLALAACAAPPAETERPAPAPLPLAGTSWTLAESGAEPSQEPTITFSAEGRAGGFTGCNQWFAQAETSDGGLAFRSIGMTRRACGEPASAVERAFGDLLRNASGGRIDGDTLVVLGEGDAELGRLTRAR